MEKTIREELAAQWSRMTDYLSKAVRELEEKVMAQVKVMVSDLVRERLGQQEIVALPNLSAVPPQHTSGSSMAQPPLMGFSTEGLVGVAAQTHSNPNLPGTLMATVFEHLRQPIGQLVGQVMVQEAQKGPGFAGILGAPSPTPLSGLSSLMASDTNMLHQ